MVCMIVNRGDAWGIMTSLLLKISKTAPSLVLKFAYVAFPLLTLADVALSHLALAYAGLAYDFLPPAMTNVSDCMRAFLKKACRYSCMISERKKI